jgi:hypothetical protein
VPQDHPGPALLNHRLCEIEQLQHERIAYDAPQLSSCVKVTSSAPFMLP